MDSDYFPSSFGSFPELPASETEDFHLGASPEGADDEDELYQSTFRGEWEKVADLYESKPKVQSSVITISKDTALHMAISDDREHVVERMVESIVKNKNEKALKMENNRGETPLHRAATRNSVTMCKRIVEAGQGMGLDLLSITNKWGEMPIFTAALHNRKPAFIFLHHAATDAYPHDAGKPYKLLRRTGGDGDTALHSAIRREHFDLAYHMIKMYPDLMGKSNVMGITPLHVLASKRSAFRSGLRLSWWKQIIYYCVHVDPLKYDPESTLTWRTSGKKPEHKCPAPDNYLTCYQFLWGSYSASSNSTEHLKSSLANYVFIYVLSFPNQLLSFLYLHARERLYLTVLGKTKEYYMRGPAKSSGSEGGRKNGRDDPEAPNNSYTNKNIPQNYTTCFEVLVSASAYLNLFRFMGFANKIRKEKEKHAWSVQILKALMEKPNTAYITGGGNPGIPKVSDPRKQNSSAQKGNGGGTDNKRSSNEEPEIYTPLLVAAQRGAIEVVNEILSQLPVSIYDTTSKGKNILQVAVENRQPRVIEAVHKQVKKELKLNLWADLIESVDTDENTILHLAAQYEESMTHPWQIHGTAMQMQWEIKWYEYVKLLSPHHFLALSNAKDETPEQIFTRGHEKLVKDSGEWLKETSESCSVVAALVAGVSFATSSSVPGGTNEDTGRPTLEQQPAFELFAITSLIGLCFSVTALIMFLSILTSRKLPRDFKRNLPLKILLGLSSLFVSIASMLISFCAAHFFVLEDRFKTAVFPLYAATCLPVSFYAIVQFPLYMDLLKSILTAAPQSLHSGPV